MTRLPINIHRWLALAAGFVLTSSTQYLSAEDWPQWRGANRDAVWNDSGVVDRFPDDGLTVKWSMPVRGGFAGPAVADGRVFVLDYQETPGSRTMDGNERLVVFDEETGALLWQQKWPATYRNLQFKFATGPRAVPTVDENRVYTLGAAGMLSCFDTETGDLLWRVDTVTDYDSTVPVQGTSQAPIVEGNLLVAAVGGEPDAKVVAFDKVTGDEVWRSLDNISETGYSAPIVIDAGGVRQLILWHATAITSLNPETGEIYWNQDFTIGGGMAITTPVRSGRYLVVSQFFNGSMMLALNPDRPDARVLWQGRNRGELPDQTDTLHSIISTPIVIDDHLYGIGSYGELRGIDARNGERVWESEQMNEQDRWATAYFVRHRDRYFVVNDSGELILARFKPDGYEELDRTHLLRPTTRTRGGISGRYRDRAVLWAHPAFANQHIVVRNDETVVRLSLASTDYQ
ncbi:MAG: PQQ-binding-like beta-propeller repeat protein [Acidobacteriota bacterium]|nr:PQQ-binding-like beta-propeller repeat protein [Acidobacteriota bacterium]